jgi:hypothetical protein
MQLLICKTNCDKTRMLTYQTISGSFLEHKIKAPLDQIDFRSNF